MAIAYNLHPQAIDPSNAGLEFMDWFEDWAGWRKLAAGEDDIQFMENVHAKVARITKTGDVLTLARDLGLETVEPVESPGPWPSLTELAEAIVTEALTGYAERYYYN